MVEEGDKDLEPSQRGIGFRTQSYRPTAPQTPASCLKSLLARRPHCAFRNELEWPNKNKRKSAKI